MTFLKVYEIQCDGCLWVLVHAYSVAECKRYIAESDWKTRNKKHYCPDCWGKFTKPIKENEHGK